MTDEIRDVESVLRAMRERDIPDDALPRADFPAVQAHMRRIRRRRHFLQGTAAVALASVAGLAIFLFARNGEDGTAGPAQGVASQLPAQPPAAQPATLMPGLTRLEPFEGLVAFLEPTTRAEFPSASHVILLLSGSPPVGLASSRRRQFTAGACRARRAKARASRLAETRSSMRRN